MSEELTTIVKGGLWTDENLDEGLDWQGETTSSDAAENETATHEPRTQRQIESDILRDAAIGEEVVNIILARVHKSLQTTKLASLEIKIDDMTKTFKDHEETVREWMKAQDQRHHESVKRSQAAMTLDTRRIDEQLATMEQKVAELIRLSTVRGTEEATMIHEAHKIIKDRQAIEEAEVSSEPSVIGRMEARMQNLNETMRKMEPYTESAVATLQVAQSTKNARQKKIGRL